MINKNKKEDFLKRGILALSLDRLPAGISLEKISSKLEEELGNSFEIVNSAEPNILVVDSQVAWKEVGLAIGKAIESFRNN